MAEKNGAAVLADDVRGRKYVPVEMVTRVFAMLDEVRRERDHEAERADRAEQVQRYWIDRFEELDADVEDKRLIGPTAFWARMALGMGGTAVIFFLLGHLAGRGVFGG